MNEPTNTNKKMLTWDERYNTLEESASISISDNELAEKIHHCHNECLKWHKMVQEWLSETQ